MNNNWTYKKLGEICDILDSKRKPITKCDRKPGNIPYYGATGIQDYVSDYIFDGRFLLVGEDGAKWGKNDNTAYIIDGKSWVNNHVHILKMHDDVIDAYVRYYLNGKDLNCYITGAIVQKLTQVALVNIPIPVPPLSTQSRIVSELDLLQSLIDKQKAQLKELDNLAQAIFYDMFGDPVENEKGWKVIKLGDECIDMKYGTSRPACKNGKYPYLRMCNISYDGYLDLNNLKTIDIPEDEVEKCSVNYGDILFNRTNSIELIGKTCMFDLKTSMVIAGYIIRVRLSDNLEPKFIAKLFNMPSMKKTLRAMAKGAVNQVNINSKELASIVIPNPPLSLQQSFAQKIKALERQRDLINQSIREAQTLFDSRMEYYFGE